MEHNCLEIYFVIDEREGTTVCTNCGKVIDTQLFLDYEVNKEKDSCNVQLNPLNKDASEILSRLNLNVNNILNDSETIKVPKLYQKINEKSAVSLKEFCAVTGIKKQNVIKANRKKVCSVDIFILLEKYCAILEVPFKDYTLIKEKITNIPYSGHPPLTIIGYFIHQVCKKNKNLSIKKICEILGISNISIQRFKKHELSRRC